MGLLFACQRAFREDLLAAEKKSDDEIDTQRLGQFRFYAIFHFLLDDVIGAGALSTSGSHLLSPRNQSKRIDTFESGSVIRGNTPVYNILCP